jgi:hypothetical protein
MRRAAAALTAGLLVACTERVASDASDRSLIGCTIAIGSPEGPVREQNTAVLMPRATVERPAGVGRWTARWDVDFGDSWEINIGVVTADGALVSGTLFQLNKTSPTPSFEGGQGFTGLHFVRVGPDLIQWFCGWGAPAAVEPSVATTGTTAG